MTSKKWILRVGLGAAVVLVAVGAWAAVNATALRANLAARQLRSAATDEARSAAADRLVALGDSGLARLVEFIRVGNDQSRAAAASAIDRHLADLPAGDPWTSATGARLLEAFASADDSGRRAVLELLPAVLARTGDAHAAKCREVVAVGMTLAEPAARLAAIRLAVRPEVKLRGAVVPLLGDPEPEVRRTALVAVATAAPGEPVVADEDLFRWLHDPDEGVRKVCHEVLVSRDRSVEEINLGRRLTHPDARERLKLLLDLRYDDLVADAEPWLERLSRDVEPAVRAGSTRVAAEMSADRRLSCPTWVGQVADADPDMTVRRVARYFKSLPLRAAAGEFRPAGGP